MEIEKAELEYLRLVGQRVREARKTIRMSQERLAELAAVHPTYISHIERGTNASICVYYRLATALKVPVVEILGATGKSVSPDALTRLFTEVAALPEREQELFVATMRGLLAGLRKKTATKAESSLKKG